MFTVRDYYDIKQKMPKEKCCGAETFLSAPNPRSRKSEFRIRLQPWLQIVLQDTLKITFFDLGSPY
jgi:hypothetical protein